MSIKPLAVLAGLALLVSAPAVPASHELELAYTADFLRNLSGGVETGTRYLDNLDVTLEIDVEEAWGAGTGTLFLYGLYNNGATFSDELVGDLLVVSNIDASRAWRLYELWYDFEHGPWSVRSGLYDLNSEFDVNPAGSLFINSSHGVGADLSQTGENGPSIFPVSSLTVRAEYAKPDYAIRVAMLDAVPGDPADPSSNSVELDEEEGVLLVGELDVAIAASGQVRAGYWRYSADFESPFDGRRYDDNDGWYVGGQYEFPLGERSATVFARYGRANPQLNPLGEYLGAGIVVQGPISRRPDDRIGIAFASGRTGDPFRQQLAAGDADAAAHETAWELTYHAQINDHLAIQPDVQFVQNPGGTHGNDAWVAGLRIELAY